MNMKKLLAGLALASSGFFATGASAALITHWNWTTDGGFLHEAGECSNGVTHASCSLAYDNTNGVTPSTIANTSSVMTWGTPSTSNASTGYQSGLQGVFGASGAGPYDAELLGSGPVNIPAFQQLVTNMDWTNTGAAIHYNNIITTDGGYMDTSLLRTSFQLLPPPFIGALNTIDIDITFNETPNINNCTFDNPHGTSCDDIFTISALPPPIQFIYANIKYTLQFRFADGPGAIVDGNTIYTAEDAPGTAVMFVQARIDAVPVPVPGALALMGVGLMLLGWRIRERKVS